MVPCVNIFGMKKTNFVPVRQVFVLKDTNHAVLVMVKVWYDHWCYSFEATTLYIQFMLMMSFNIFSPRRPTVSQSNFCWETPCVLKKIFWHAIDFFGVSLEWLCFQIDFHIKGLDFWWKLWWWHWCTPFIDFSDYFLLPWCLKNHPSLTLSLILPSVPWNVLLILYGICKGHCVKFLPFR